MKILTAVALIVLVVVGFYAYPHLWYQVGTGEARSPAGPIGDVTVYKSTQGPLLFVYQEDSGEQRFILDPATVDVGIPNGGQFTILSSIAYSSDVRVPVVSSKSVGKIGFDMDIVINDKIVEFNIRPEIRLRAERNNF